MSWQTRGADNVRRDLVRLFGISRKTELRHTIPPSHRLVGICGVAHAAARKTIGRLQILDEIGLLSVGNDEKAADTDETLEKVLLGFNHFYLAKRDYD